MTTIFQFCHLFPISMTSHKEILHLVSHQSIREVAVPLLSLEKMEYYSLQLGLYHNKHLHFEFVYTIQYKSSIV